MENVEGPYVQPKPTLGEKVDRLTELIEQGGNGKKPKPFRMPIKGRLGNAKLKKGYATICKVEENGAIAFIKEPITDGTIKLGDTFHAIGSDDILTYKGKPFIIQSMKSKNPCNPNAVDNNTYGQKHIMSRMMNETLSMKKKVGIGMSIGVIIIVAIIGYAFIAG